MKFKIEKETKVRKVNINGKVLSSITYYYVYRSILFGLIRQYLNVNQVCISDSIKEVGYRFVSFDMATPFTEEEAKELLRQLNENPDKFVKYL